MHTEKLTTEEKDIVLPMLLKALKKGTEDKPLVSDRIVKWFNENKEQIGMKTNFTAARLRKLTNYCRTFGIAPVIANSRGYYISNKKKDLVELKLSIISRIESLQAVVKGIDDMMNELNLVEIEIDALGFEWIKK
jgi:hypothetical protein